jgi:hypothetical protein
MPLGRRTTREVDVGRTPSTRFCDAEPTRINGEYALLGSTQIPQPPVQTPEKLGPTHSDPVHPSIQTHAKFAVGFLCIAGSSSLSPTGVFFSHDGVGRYMPWAAAVQIANGGRRSACGGPAAGHSLPDFCGSRISCCCPVIGSVLQHILIG